MINAVFYGRYSSAKQNETSIEAQLIVCREFAQRNGINIIREYVDEGISAKTSNRPQFQQMIKDSYQKEFQRIVVYQLDRFCRNRTDSAIYRNILQENGVKIMSAKENITDDYTGILTTSVIEGLNEFFLLDLSNKVSRNMCLNAEKGQFNGRHCSTRLQARNTRFWYIQEKGTGRR